MFDGLLAEWIVNSNVVAIATIAIVVGVPIIAGLWYSLEVHKLDNALKHSMIERGMSADEIERILAAKSTKSKERTGSAD